MSRDLSLVQLMGQSKNAIVREVFSSTDSDSRRRPETVGPPVYRAANLFFQPQLFNNQ